MAQEGYASNLYGSKQLGDLSVILIKLGVGAGQAALIASDSSPNVTVATPGAGVYNVTFPGGQGVFLLASESVNQGTVKGALTALTQSNSVASATLTLSDAGDLAGSEQYHLAFLVESN